MKMPMPGRIQIAVAFIGGLGIGLLLVVVARLLLPGLIWYL
jgi:hypothetical protein